MSIELYRVLRLMIDVFESFWIFWLCLFCVDNIYSGIFFILYFNCDKFSIGVIRVYFRKIGKVVMISEIVDFILLKMVSLVFLVLVLFRLFNLDFMWVIGLGVVIEKWGYIFDEVICKVLYCGIS